MDNCPGKNNKNKNNDKNNGEYKGKIYGKCHNCGKPGHHAQDCWEKENKSKHLVYFKPASEKGNMTADGGRKVEDLLSSMDAEQKHEECNSEVVMSSMTFLAKLGLLDDTNVWIADTVATVQSTPHAAGMVYIKKASGQDTVTMGNGANIKATSIGSINGTICDKFSNEVCVS